MAYDFSNNFILLSVMLYDNKRNKFLLSPCQFDVKG